MTKSLNHGIVINMNKYSLTQEQLQSVVDYFSKQPYAEVYKLMAMLLTLPVEKQTEQVPPATLVKDVPPSVS